MTGTEEVRFGDNINDEAQKDDDSFNIWTYLRVEMFGIGEPGSLEPPVQSDQIENFFIVPLNLEILLFLGFFICLDAFLYVITYLPIRVMYSIYVLVMGIYSQVIEELGFHSVLPFLFPKRKGLDGHFSRFHRTQAYDIMRGAMFIVGFIALKQINMSQVYHFIRGQSIIKLYVLTSMMEIVDKLMCSFGQDAFDALHWQTRHNPQSLKLLAAFAVATGYVALHSAVYFLHVATLTVVINSADSSLVSVLVLNNFAELKTFVLKKFDSNNLFQLSCSDMTERFQMFLFLSLILVVALAQSGDAWKETIQNFIRVGFLMFFGECFADWFKHAFISKFNLISATIYEDFAYVLRNDILSNQKDEIILDHTYSVTRRIGLAQLPLGCVFVRYIMLMLSTPSIQMYLEKKTWLDIALQASALFIILLIVKIVLGIGLYFYSADAHRRDKNVFIRSVNATINVSNDRVSNHERTLKDMRNRDSKRAFMVGTGSLSYPETVTMPREIGISNRGSEGTLDGSNHSNGETGGESLFGSGIHETDGPLEGIHTVGGTTATTTSTWEDFQEEQLANIHKRIALKGQRDLLKSDKLGTILQSEQQEFHDNHVFSNDMLGRVPVSGMQSPGRMRTGSGASLYTVQSSSHPVHFSTPLVKLDSSKYFESHGDDKRSVDVDGMGTPVLSSAALLSRSLFDDSSRDTMLVSDENSDSNALYEAHQSPRAGKGFSVVETSASQAERIRERMEFMEELSSIERYTVYKGRIV